MPYVLLDEPDAEFPLPNGTYTFPVATLVSDVDEGVRAHIFMDDRCFCLAHNATGTYIVTPHWFREAAEALANLILSEEPRLDLPQKPPPEEVPDLSEVPETQGSMVYLTEVGPRRINVIKAIRSIHGHSLRDSKMYMEQVEAGIPYYLGTSPPTQWVSYLHEHGAKTKNVLAPSMWEHLGDEE